MKKVFSIVFDTFSNDSRVLKEARTLKNNGYDIQIVAVHAYPLAESEIISDIPVNRLKLLWNHKRSFSQQLVNFEFFYRVIKNFRNGDIYHCNDLNTLGIGVIIKLFFSSNAKIVYDAHEYETQRVSFTRIKSFQAEVFERVLIRYVDVVLTVSDSIADEYVKLYDIKRPYVVMNTPSYHPIEKSNIFREKFNIPQEKTIFLYQGRLGKGRGIEKMLECFAGDDDNVVVFMGYGPLSGLIMSAGKRHKNIYLHPPVALDDVIRHTTSADYGIALIENVCLSYYYSLPNKLFEFIMSGLPIVVSNLYELSKFVQTYEVGSIVKDNTVKGLKQAISEVKMIDKQNVIDKIEIIKKIYSWEQQEIIFLSAYKNLFQGESTHE